MAVDRSLDLLPCGRPPMGSITMGKLLPMILRNHSYIKEVSLFISLFFSSSIFPKLQELQRLKPLTSLLVDSVVSFVAVNSSDFIGECFYLPWTSLVKRFVETGNSGTLCAITSCCRFTIS